jgi:dipeptidyl-peptidase 4
MMDSFPAEYARTLNYTLGSARTFRISSGGERVFFLRSAGPTQRRLDLWCLNVYGDESGSREILLVDTAHLQLDSGAGDDPETERLRKERVREAASGITAYAIDDFGSTIAFSFNGDVYVKRIGEAALLRLSVGDASGVALSPDGRKVSYVARNELHIARVGPVAIEPPIRISPPATDTVSWGLPEFIAAEEMQRHEGYWWAPDSKSLLFAKVDEAPVQVWYLSDPSNPAARPRAVRYPSAGTANAEVSVLLWTEGVRSVEVEWDNNRFPYLVAVRWRLAVPTLVVQDRSQRGLVVLSVDPATGETAPVYNKSDPAWVEVTSGVPTWSRAGDTIDISTGETRELTLAGRRVSKPGLEVRKFIGETASAKLVYLASDDPTAIAVWASDGVTHTSLSSEEGVFDARVGGTTVAVFGATMADSPLRAEIVDLAANTRTALVDLAMNVTIRPRPRFCRSPARIINYALLLPRDASKDRKLPILVNSYGGPMAQRCLKSTLLFTTSQWFAEQGFAVIVADGRGTPGRGRQWETAIARDLIGPVLEDQVEALEHVIATNPCVDPTRVAIRGWSFGGYLAAMAVLLQPDRFHAAVAGAPVIDWRYYDTHFTERYLGPPEENQAAYDSCSAVMAAHRLMRPLLLIHGLDDDNVVSAHTLRMSQALFEAGRLHNVLPLIRVTHMPAAEVAAENLLHFQLAFLRQELGLA